jgi:hypothetical protein
MGVDTVSVGLRHKLRVNRPLSFFEDVSNAYNANVRVVYYNCNERRMFTLFKLKKESAIENLLIYPPECQYLQQLATPNVSSNSVDWESEALLKQLWDAICQDGGYYEISGFKDNKDLKIEIYRETVYIGLVAPFRWYSFLENFTLGPEYHYPDDASMLQDYRKELCRHAQSLGCDEVIYIADQDAGELIFDQIDKPVNDLLNYIANRGFYKEMDKLIRQAKEVGHISSKNLMWIGQQILSK